MSVSTWMGDHLWAGKLCQYVNIHLGKLSLAIEGWNNCMGSCSK